MPFTCDLGVGSKEQNLINLYGGISCQLLGPVGGGISKQWKFRHMVQDQHLELSCPKQPVWWRQPYGVVMI